MTLAKGPLVAPETCNIPGGGHVLLIAINHYPAFGRVPPEHVDAVHAELNQYKDALRSLFNKHGHDMVVYEIAREAQRGLSHAHLQIVAVPKGSSDNIEAIVQEEAAKAGYALQNERSDSDRDYFDMELPNGKHLIHLLHPKTRFNLQFGRQTLARALGQDDRADWKNCKQETDDEKQAGKAFKGAFKPFDFTL
ncbi:CwfJ C-terminus 2-domain-containing protein-like protein [Gongronella butleri]|nr:CwfJ C-terminus 2-domain-containing protein-like protein [Gongronella butleri]